MGDDAPTTPECLSGKCASGDQRGSDDLQSSRAAEHYAEVQDHCLKTQVHEHYETCRTTAIVVTSTGSRGARRCRSTTSSDAQVHEHYETCRTTAIVVTSTSSRGARRCRSTTSSDAQVHQHYETCRTTAIVVTSLALEEHACRSTTSSDAQVHEHHEMCRTIA